ncbi:hypothetical protein [Polyangium aurulentum]|uniref:hypothetical protein n=1 Tax=Polyangium aurulentum TaxID=2567896 RepID=UPI0010ADAE72|nr:hypothetical protein [Polyangium aurulentum]UQA62241.1 hypothetical protein E8A73_017925 [Polyangium aurulentum]
MTGVLAGCAPEIDPSSEEVSSRDLRMNVAASDEGSGATIEIQLDGILGPVRLSGGDALRVTMVGAAVPFGEVQGDRGIAYVAAIDALTEDLVVDLQRPNDRSATHTAEVPPPFTLTSAGISGAAPLAMQWDAAPGEHELLLGVVGECIEPIARPLAQDTGAYAIGQAELFHAGPGAAATCPLTLTLTRTATTQRDLNEGVVGGWFYARIVQSRAIEVSWSP